jgi:hypothetical protein
MKLQELNEASNTKKQEIAAWLDRYVVKKYTINDDLSVNVKGNVNLMHHGLQSIPVQFNRVTGDFDYGNNQLESLQGAPQMVGGYFNCSGNDLKSLQGAPREVGGGFDCSQNPLESLEGISRIIRTMKGKMYIPHTVTSHILGLARIRGLRKMGRVIGAKRLQQAIDIIDNNINGKGNIHEAQEQMLEAGLQEFAQL